MTNVLVSRFDLTNNDILRCGLIPIYKQGDVILIALVVSKYSTSISSIGGTNEYSDYDLLQTVTRETAEEVGDYFGEIDDEDLYGCHAIVTKSTFTVLYPVDKINTHFRETAEIKDVIWLTPEQILILKNNPDIKFINEAGGYVKISKLSENLSLIVDTLVAFVKSGIPFIQEYPDENFKRPQKITPKYEPLISSRFQDLVAFINEEKSFIPNLFIVYDNKSLVAGNNRGDIFILSRSDLIEIDKIHTGTNFYIRVSLPSDNIFKHKNDSISLLIRRLRYPDPLQFDKTVEKLRRDTNFLGVRSGLLEELELQIEEEKNLYVYNRERGLYFNRDKWLFFKILTAVNIYMLDNKRADYWSLVNFLQSLHLGINPRSVLQTLHENNMYVRKLITIHK